MKHQHPLGDYPRSWDEANGATCDQCDEFVSEEGVETDDGRFLCDSCSDEEG